ncbi:MAG: SBBP repeat-containing protein [bacterium]|nr:SBBP repeat-containing protein [bacterium]
MSKLLFFLVLLLPAVSLAEPSVSYRSIVKPETFIQNCGQWPDSILFQTKVNGAVVWFGRSGLYYQLFKRNEAEADSSDQHLTRLVHEELVGANRNAEVVGENESNYYCNYFLGNDSTKWTTDVPTFSSIRYYDIYPGIDLRYYFRNGHLEYDFLLSPSADPLAIQINYQGIDSLITGAAGELVVATDWGKITQQPPTVYEATTGRPVMCEYQIEANSFGFSLPPRRSDLAIVIDPVLMFSSYLGGNQNEFAWDVSVDKQKNIYVVGYTRSVDFPGQVYLDTTYDWDIFVTKLEPMGRSILWTAVFRGTEIDIATSCKVDQSGNIVVVGTTTSTDFPMYRPLPGRREGITDGIVFKLTKNGNQLLFSTLIGGLEKDSITSVALDKSGNIYWCGNTWSTDYPTKSAFRSAPTEVPWGFVSKMSPEGDSLIFSTYLGFSDDYFSIAVDNSNHAVVAGRTWDKYFPLVNPIDVTRGDVGTFITKFTPNGDSLVFSTFLSASQGNAFRGVAIDSEDRIYVTGTSHAVYYDEQPYPLANPLAGLAWLEDGVVSLLDPTGQDLIFSTYWGGWESSHDEFRDIAVDSSGYFTVVGYFDSPEYRFINAIDSTIYWASGEVSIVKFAPNGSDIVYSTLLGGRRGEGCWALDVDNSGNVYVVGATASDDWPLLDPVDSIFAGTVDRPADCLVAIISDSPTDVSEDTEGGLPLRFTLHQNYPNPFNGETIIQFDLPRAAVVDLSIFNILGEKVRTVVTQPYPAGSHQVFWSGNDNHGNPVASGVYFYRITTESGNLSKKLLLLK